MTRLSLRVTPGLWIFASFIGLLSAFDILIIGEELSTLGDRAHALLLRSSDSVHYFGELAIGLTAFGLSILRLVTVRGLFANARWGYWMAAIFLGPFVLLDIGMLSPPFAAVLVLADLCLLGAVVRCLWKRMGRRGPASA